MFEKELQQKIRWLNDPNGGNLPLKVLVGKFFIDQPQYLELKNEFRMSEYHNRHWEWHQLVRMVLDPMKTSQYMYERLLRLLLNHRRSYQDYFELETREGIYPLPNPAADLNKLEILYQRYFDIYRGIKDGIHFDYPQNDHYGRTIKGKINWDRTIRNSSTRFPMMFVSSIKQKEFETPENILLVLAAEWMFRESSRLLQTNFAEPLSDDQSQLLQSVVERTKVILENFPFPTVLNSSKKFQNLSIVDPRIMELEQKSRNRIREGVIRNASYPKLMEWIDDFRNLDISRVTDATPTRHILDSIENLDTVYEAWIFLEFVEFLHKKGVLINLSLRKNNRFCQFEYNGVVVTLWYEKTFTENEGHAWFLEHRPDFTAMAGDEILAIFDAKNYSSGSDYAGSQNKMLAYMTNLDTNFGALIYPIHPKNWDDLSNEEKLQHTINFLKKKLPEEIPSIIRNMAMNVVSLSWNELPQEYKEILPPLSNLKFDYPHSGMKARYHFEQTLCLLRMPPDESPSSLRIKDGSLNLIYNEIVRRIPIELTV